MKNVYKNYYCGICFALEKNYGEAARMLLSYDVVILGLLAKAYREPRCERLPCFFKKEEKIQFMEEDWRKIAAINILLFSAKIDDDIHDEKSVKAKCAGAVMNSVIKKAKNDYPDLAIIITEGYKKMALFEEQGKHVIEICNAFSIMMMNLLHCSFSLNKLGLDYIGAVSGWLYFIDQLDDYDEDIKKGKYNPCIIKGVTKTEFVNRYHANIREILNKLMRDYGRLKKELNIRDLEERILYSILNETIPSVTMRILTDRKLPQVTHKKKKVEWREPS